MKSNRFSEKETFSDGRIREVFFLSFHDLARSTFERSNLTSTVFANCLLLEDTSLWTSYSILCFSASSYGT